MSETTEAQGKEPAEDTKLTQQLAVSLWFAEAGRDRPETAEERRTEWAEKKTKYMPVARRLLRILRQRGVKVELGTAKDVE
jgi:phosphoserine phosphatase